MEVTTEPPPDISERSTISLRTRALARWSADAGYDKRTEPSLLKRLALALALMSVVASPAHAQKTKAQLNTEIGTTYPDNILGQITPAGIRAYETDVINSIMPTAPVVAGNLACFSGTTGLLQDCGSAPATVPLTVGTTPIGGGTTTNVLFDNAGKLGEYTVTGSGSVVMSVAPTITLPNATGLPLSTGVTGTLQAAQEPAHTGDCTNTAGSLALTCTKTNGVAFAAGATAAAGQLPGTATNDNASAGNVGEFPSNTCASAAITSGTQTNCSAGLSLTAGDWDVQGVVYYSPNSASTNLTDMYCSISLTSGTLDQTFFNFTRISFGSAGITPGSNVVETAVCPTRRVSVSTTTPVFLVAFTDFTVSTMNFSGGIRARRVR